MMATKALSEAKRVKLAALRRRVARGEELKPYDLRLLGQLEAEASGRGAAKNFDELAQALGVGRRTVARWSKLGMPRDPDGTYDLEAVRVWREARGNRNGHRSPWPQTQPQVPGTPIQLCARCEPLVRAAREFADYWDAQDKCERALTRRAKRRAIERELVPKALVERDRVARALRLRADFEGWAYEFPLRLVTQHGLGAGAISEIRRLVIEAGREWLGRYAEDREYVTDLGEWGKDEEDEE